MVDHDVERGRSTQGGLWRRSCTACPLPADVAPACCCPWPKTAACPKTGACPRLPIVQGIVSIPGMMTGQILGGSDPAVAARYQIIVMFLIGAATGLSSGAKSALD